MHEEKNGIGKYRLPQLIWIVGFQGTRFDMPNSIQKIATGRSSSLLEADVNLASVQLNELVFCLPDLRDNDTYEGIAWQRNLCCISGIVSN